MSFCFKQKSDFVVSTSKMILQKVPFVKISWVIAITGKKLGSDKVNLILVVNLSYCYIVLNSNIYTQILEYL